MNKTLADWVEMREKMIEAVERAGPAQFEQLKKQTINLINEYFSVQVRRLPIEDKK